MSILNNLYRSPLGRVISSFGRFVAKIHKPFMVYGFIDPQSGQFRKWTRLSSNAIIMNPAKLSIGDHVWVWHHSIIDATEGVTIGEGCQIGAWVGIFSHGSENSIRLLGNQFVHIPNTDRLGYTRGSVAIGPYSFIAASTVILPGVSIGKGCLIAAGSLVDKDIPDYSIAVGSPAKVKARTVDLDRRFFRKRDFSETYFDKDALNLIKSCRGKPSEQGDSSMPDES